ncbi:MAG TPA: DnaA/Hda family protein, partial [Acetobacteraceae bacterium]|nr:DnaA/Hda family protein [Acetobacteraceae bacterium]
MEQPSGGDPQLAAQWARVRGRLQGEVGEVEYRTLLRQMTLVGFDDSEITVQLPTKFLRDWVRGHYGDKLLTLWQAEIRRVRRVEFVVANAGAVDPAPEQPPAATRAEPPRAEVSRIEPEARPDMAAPLEQRFTFDSFVVGKPNEFAYACARRVAEHPASVGFNPLFLYGGVGLGKTHLMHAMAWDLTCRNTGRVNPVSVAYMSAEKFMYRF